MAVAYLDGLSGPRKSGWKKVSTERENGRYHDQGVNREG